MIIFNPFHRVIKPLLLGMECVFRHQDLQMCGLKLANMITFHPLKVDVKFVYRPLCAQTVGSVQEVSSHRAARPV